MSIFNEFPYTNFHEMNLDWIIARVKEWLAIAESWEQWKNDTDQAIEDLKAYIDNFIDNLDLQDEVNNKIDEMIANGTLANIINVQIFADLNTKIIDVQNWSESEEDLDAYRDEVRRCAASYLMYSYGSNSVSNDNIPTLNKVCWKYDTNYGYMGAMGRYIEFKYNDTQVTTDGTLPVVYADCAVFTSLINKCRSYLESPYYYAVNTPNPDPTVIFNKSMENGDIYDKPYTFDFLNNYNTSRMAYITERAGIEFWQISSMNRNDNAPTTMDLDNLKTGDIVYRARSGQNIYKGIDHCGTFIQSLDELANADGVLPGTVFKAYNDHVSDIGYIIEFTGSSGGADYIDCMRLTAIEDWFTDTIATHDWIRCYAARPISSVLTSNKAYSRLTGIVNCYDYTLNVLQERGANGEYVAAKMNANIAGGWILTSGQDLNDILTDGVYKCNSAAVAATLINAPGTTPYDNFTLIAVGINKAMTYGTQIAIGVSQSSYQYLAMRTLSNNIWSPWVNIATLSNVSGNVGVKEAASYLLSTGSISAGTYQDFDITFSEAFTEAPKVMLTREVLNSQTIATPLVYAAVINGSITTTGFKIRVYNAGDTATSDTYFRWFAYTCKQNA